MICPLTTVPETQPGLLTKLRVSEGKNIRLPKGRNIYAPQSTEKGVYRLIKGMVATYVVGPNEKVLGLQLLRPGDFFGFETLLPNFQTKTSTLMPSAAVFWAKDKIMSMCERQEELAKSIILAQAQLNTDLIRRLADMGLLKTKQRTAAFLMQLCKGREDGDLCLLPALSQRVIAEFVGTNRYVITSIMNSFRKNGFVEYDRTNLQLRNPKGFWSWVSTQPFSNRQ